MTLEQNKLIHLSVPVLRVQTFEAPSSCKQRRGGSLRQLDPSPQLAPPTRDCLSKIKDRQLKERREAARKQGLEEGVENGRQESAETVDLKEQDRQITDSEQKSQIKKFTEQLALETAHLLSQINAVICVLH